MRMRQFDYSSQGAYFVTIVTNNRLNLFGRVEDEEMKQNEAGTMVAKEYRQRFISKGIDGGEDVLTEGYERATQATSTGFIFEVKIAWANFANNKIAVYQPQSGDVVKFNVAVTDISYPCPGTEYIPQMAWTGTLEINTNPSLWGNLVFE